MVRVEGFQLLLSKWDCTAPRSRCSLIVWPCTKILPPTSAFNIFFRDFCLCFAGGSTEQTAGGRVLVLGRSLGAGAAFSRVYLWGEFVLASTGPAPCCVSCLPAPWWEMAEAADLMECSKQDAESHPGEAAASCLSVLHTMGRQNHSLVTLGRLLAARCGRGSRWRYN